MGKPWRLMGIAALVAFGLAAIVLAISGLDPEGIRRALRMTARFSFLLFWCAYAGGSLAALFGERFRPLARQGRNFGLAFASAHSIHLVLVIWLYRLLPEPPISPQFAVFFSIGMLWMYLLAVFSIERLSRTLSPGLWRILRLLGMEYIMLAFQADFLPGSLPDAKHLIFYGLFAALGLAGTAMRFIAWLRKRASPRRVGGSAHHARVG